jgi:hypothetical protein
VDEGWPRRANDTFGLCPLDGVCPQGRARHVLSGDLIFDNLVDVRVASPSGEPRCEDSGTCQILVMWFVG